LEKNMKAKNILIVTTPVIAAMLIACGSASKSDNVQGPGAQAQPSGSASSAQDTIVMTVTGPDKASITFGLDSDISQDNDAVLPWKRTLHGSGGVVSMATVSAQNSTTGTISCKITVNGKTVKENSSSGQYAIVDCTATNW
jgi:hypothetical protein